MVDTVQGPKYSGCCYQGQLSTVSILRAGEVLEPAISAVCKVIRMGKILIQTNEYSEEPEVSGECHLPLTIKPPLPASPHSPIAPPCLLSLSLSLPQLHYLRLPPDVASCHVLLLDATVATGAAALMAIRVLLVGPCADDEAHTADMS